MRRMVANCVVAAGIALAMAGCTDPNDPGQRTVGGGLIGAAGGAAVGGLAGGGGGALAGGLLGGAVGAGTGYITTPHPERRGY